MTRPQRYLRHMTFFVVGAAAVTILLYEPLLNAFLANPVFNGLIAAVLLFQFGTGPVKGFAVTLAIGLVTSMFTAIMLTRLFVVTWLRQRRPQALPV